ncbi:hypothetical protein VULLAG_LOCUS5801 [Vulpes lagopus]
MKGPAKPYLPRTPRPAVPQRCGQKGKKVQRGASSGDGEASPPEMPSKNRRVTRNLSVERELRTLGARGVVTSTRE